MNEINQFCSNSTIPIKSLISCASLIIGEIMILLSIALISEFNSALHDYGEQEEQGDYYVNPNFFRSKTGILITDIFLMILLAILFFFILTKKQQSISIISFWISLILFIRIIISLVFLIDPTEKYVEYMRFEYFNAVIDNPNPQNKYKRFLLSWRQMYDNEIVQLFFLNIFVGYYFNHIFKLNRFEYIFMQ